MGRDGNGVGGEFFRIRGQVAVVTGGARGIGEGIARRFASAGARVAVWDLDGEGAARLAGELETDSTGFRVDVTDGEGVSAGFDRVERELGAVSILVNSAGVTGRAAASWELSLEEFRGVLEVNLIGVFATCRALAPRLLERGYGRIVNIASIAGKEGNPTLSAYSASKAGVINFTKALGKEMAGRGDVTVNAISPAVIRTPLLEGLPQSTIDYMVSRIPMGRTGRIEEVAALAHYLASPEAGFCTGQCYDLSGGRATY